MVLQGGVGTVTAVRKEVKEDYPEEAMASQDLNTEQKEVRAGRGEVC